MQDGLVPERIATHHIHVNVGAQPGPDLRMPAEIGHRTFDLRPPHEAQRPLRAWQGPGLDQSCQDPGGLQNGDTTAPVVVGSRPLVIQMAAVNYVSAGGVRPRDYAADQGPVPRADRGFYLRG
jgi:hypothetical protein